MQAKIWLQGGEGVVVPAGHARGVIERLCRGGTTLREQAKRLGIPHHRTALRRALVGVLGSEEVLARLLKETDPSRNPAAGRRAITRYGFKSKTERRELK